jgi:hypothetical protein
MLTCLRYALATVCFVASVGCLALWGWSQSNVVDVIFPLPTWPAKFCVAEAYRGLATTYTRPGWIRPQVISNPLDSALLADDGDARLAAHGIFGESPLGYYFPLWYPALIFALAGIGALRLGRRFTLRAAIIATTVVAGLLGMAVIL